MNKLFDAKFDSFGSYVPKKIVDNFDLEKIVDTSDEWIRTRTGMFERHYVGDNEATSDLALNAAEDAIKKSTVRVKEIEMIVIGTISGDYAFPSTACLVANRLGLKGIPAFDVSAGCSGFMYASEVARQFISSGSVKNALVIGAEILTRTINWNDRGTCVLFGDGAGAAIMSQALPTDISRIIDVDIVADGSDWKILYQPAGGSRIPASEKSVAQNLHTIYMEGNRVFIHAVKSMALSCQKLLKRNNMDQHDIDWIIPHQANLRIIDALADKLKLQPEKVIKTIHKYGNTSSSTVPIAMTDSLRENRIRRGDIVLFTTFGAGLTTGSMLFRY